MADNYGPHAYDDYVRMLDERLKNPPPPLGNFIPPVRYAVKTLAVMTPKKVKHRSGLSYRQRQARHRKMQRPPKEALH